MRRTTSTPKVDHQKTLLAAREQMIAHGIETRRISEAQADEYRRMFDASPFAVKNLLTASIEDGGLAPGVVPPALPAYSGLTPPPAAAPAPQSNTYPAEWLPEAAAPPGGQITFEDQQSAMEAISNALPLRSHDDGPDDSAPSGRVTFES